MGMGYGQLQVTVHYVINWSFLRHLITRPEEWGQVCPWNNHAGIWQPRKLSIQEQEITPQIRSAHPTPYENSMAIHSRTAQKGVLFAVRRKAFCMQSLHAVPSKTPCAPYAFLFMPGPNHPALESI